MLLALVPLVAVLWRLEARGQPHKVIQVHHGYVGVWLIWWTLPYLWHPAACVGFVAGVWFYADDLWQHLTQLWYESYRSPIHDGYQHLFGSIHRKAVARWPWLGRL